MSQEELTILDQHLENLVLLEGVQEIMKERKTQLRKAFSLLESGKLNPLINAQKKTLTRPPWNLPDLPRPTMKLTSEMKLEADPHSLKLALSSKSATTREQLNVVGMKKFIWPRPIGTDRINVAHHITIKFLNKLESINRHRLLTGKPILNRDEILKKIVTWLETHNSKRPSYDQIGHLSSIAAAVLIAYPV